MQSVLVSPFNSNYDLRLVGEGVRVLVEGDRRSRASEGALVAWVSGGGQAVDLFARVVVDKP